MEKLEKKVKLVLWFEYAFDNLYTDYDMGSMERYGIESIEINDVILIKDTHSAEVGAMKRGDGISVHIIATRPGLLIGKKGCQINNVTKVLKNKFGEDTIFTISESKMWRDIFDK